MSDETKQVNAVIETAVEAICAEVAGATAGRNHLDSDAHGTEMTGYEVEGVESPAQYIVTQRRLHKVDRDFKSDESPRFEVLEYTPPPARPTKKRFPFSITFALLGVAAGVAHLASGRFVDGLAGAAFWCAPLLFQTMKQRFAMKAADKKFAAWQADNEMLRTTNPFEERLQNYEDQVAVWQSKTLDTLKEHVAEQEALRPFRKDAAKWGLDFDTVVEKVRRERPMHSLRHITQEEREMFVFAEERAAKKRKMEIEEEGLELEQERIKNELAHQRVVQYHAERQAAQALEANQLAREANHEAERANREAATAAKRAAEAAADSADAARKQDEMDRHRARIDASAHAAVLQGQGYNGAAADAIARNVGRPR